jgi:hypothetical protein
MDEFSPEQLDVDKILKVLRLKKKLENIGKKKLNKSKMETKTKDEPEEIIKGVKGFDKDLKCRDFQYEVGKEYETDKKPVRCTKNGFHFCINPLDVFSYYAPGESKYHEVKGSGQKDTAEDDSKIAVSKIKIGAEISLFDMIRLGVECILKRVDFKNTAATNTGDQSAATNTGYQSAATNTGDQSAATNTGSRSAATNTGNQSAATNTGDQSAATNTGNYSAASVEGKDSIACGLGIENKAKASLGSWIVITEWKQDEDYNWHIKNMKSAKIDDKKLLADTFYKLENGEFVKAE